MFTNICASYLTLFHFVFPLLLCSHNPLRWGKMVQAESVSPAVTTLWLLASLLSFLFTLSIFLIICPLLLDGLPSLWAWLSLGYSWPPHFSQAPSKGRAGFVHACLGAFLIFSISSVCPWPQLAHQAVYKAVLHACFEFQREDNCCVYWQKRQKHVSQTTANNQAKITFCLF